MVGPISENFFNSYRAFVCNEQLLALSDSCGRTRGYGHCTPLVPPAYASDDVLPADEQAKDSTVAGKPALEKTPSAPAPLYVDVKGDVKQPGLYPLDAGMRVADAIAKAGEPIPLPILHRSTWRLLW